MSKSLPNYGPAVWSRASSESNMLETIVGLLGMALIGVIGWAVKLSNRVTALESNKESLRELLEIDRATLREMLDLRLVDITRRLDRIEIKLDAKVE